MRALVLDNKKLVLRQDYPMPAPKEGEALVKVSCAGICATDLEITKGYMGFSGVPGHEFTGVVEECFDDRFEGRRVTGEINLWCGKCDYCRKGMRNHCLSRTVLGILGRDGAFADYLTIPVRNLHPLPDSITDEEGVFVEPLAAVYEIAEQVDLSRIDNACVLGDGRLGLLAAMALESLGCRVIAVGRHPEKLGLLESRGIKTAVGVEGLSRDFGLVVDCTGSTDGFNDALGLVRPRGVVVLKTTVAERKAADLNRVVIDEITVIGSRCGPFKPAIAALAEKTVDVAPLISKVFPLDEGVEAIEHAGRKGALKVLLRMG